MSDTTVWWKQPARNWIDAVPVGDGRLGAKVFGGTDRERLALNIETLWSGKPQVHGVTNGPATLKTMRDLLLADRRVDAGEANRAFQGPFNHAYQPLGDVFIDFVAAGEISDYRTELDLHSGIVTCQFKRDGVGVRRRVFVSGATRAIVAIIEATAPIEIRLSLETPHPVHLRHADAASLGIAGFAPATVDREACHAAGQNHPGSKLTYGPDAGVGFASALRVSGDCDSRVAGEALLVRGTTIVLQVTAETTFEDWRRAPGRDIERVLQSARAEADKAAAVGIAELLQRQERDHGELFGRASLELDAPDAVCALPIDDRMQLVRDGGEDPGLFALFYGYARYLLMASSRRDNALPANLQGIWNDNRNPPWFSSFTTNINVQMNYWLAEPGNLSECATPYLSYIESLAVAGTTTAREMFGFDGWCVNHNADIWRATWPSGEGLLRPTWSFETTCGLWLASAFAERDAFVSDDAFVRDRALPLYEGAVRFALDLLVRTSRGLVVLPSTSPENEYVDHSGASVDFDVQTTYDLWLVREALETYLAFATRLGVNTDLTRRATLAMSELEHPRIGSDGRLMEWSEEFDEPEPGHRHMSHLYGLYPGNHIDPVTTPQYAEAARRSIEARMAGGSPEHGWPHAWMAALLARLHDAQEAHRVLNSFVRTSVPGSSLNYHSFLVYQIDGNLGVGAAISEMLLQSHRGVVRPLPALPAQWSSGRYTGFRARGGVTVSVNWRDGQGRVELLADADTTVTVAFPDQPEATWSVALAKNVPWTHAFALTRSNV